MKVPSSGWSLSQNQTRKTTIPTRVWLVSVTKTNQQKEKRNRFPVGSCPVTKPNQQPTGTTKPNGKQKERKATDAGRPRKKNKSRSNLRAQSFRLQLGGRNQRAVGVQRLGTFPAPGALRQLLVVGQVHVLLRMARLDGYVLFILSVGAPNLDFGSPSKITRGSPPKERRKNKTKTTYPYGLIKVCRCPLKENRCSSLVSYETRSTRTPMGL